MVAIRSLDQIAAMGGLEAVKEKIALVKKINEEVLEPLGGLEEAERLVAGIENLSAKLERLKSSPKVGTPTTEAQHVCSGLFVLPGGSIPPF